MGTLKRRYYRDVPCMLLYSSAHPHIRHNIIMCLTVKLLYVHVHACIRMITITYHERIISVLLTQYYRVRIKGPLVVASESRTAGASEQKMLKESSSTVLKAGLLV